MEALKSLGRKHAKGSSIPPPIICEDPSDDDKKCKEISLKPKRVNKALTTFRDLSHKLFCEYKSSLQLGNLQARTKALLEAAMLMKKKHQWENTKKQVGHVAGVEVGDRFQYRTELIIIGLHHQFSGGIDYMGKGENSLATSIVVTHRYDNVMKSSGSLVYVGQGGNPNVRGNVLPHDQKLEGGNLALKNSMDARSPVRVTFQVSRKSDGMEEQWSNSNSTSNCSYVYVYDGLYLVDNMVEERGEFDKLVFKFILNKISGQPTCVTPQDVVMEGGLGYFSWRKRQRYKSHVVKKDVFIMTDVSGGKERCPIRVVTPMSCVQKPPPFDYIVDMAYPKKFNFKQQILSGCDCAYNTCGDCQKCACIVMNGGTMPYDCKKRLASHMMSSPLVIFECSPSCKCSSSCINRVSQCGIQFQLEIFKTEMKGWGVRTRSFIPSGSFVCELIGEVHYNRRATGSRLEVDSDYIFNIGGDKGFNIDATRCGNIGRFINHSCSPNLCIKDVMYDHNDESLPHKMLFAVKDIAARRELSFDYNCCKGNVKVHSNNCYCGSVECKGQIYIRSSVKGDT